MFYRSKFTVSNLEHKNILCRFGFAYTMLGCLNIWKSLTKKDIFPLRFVSAPPLSQLELLCFLSVLLFSFWGRILWLRAESGLSEWRVDREKRALIHFFSVFQWHLRTRRGLLLWLFIRFRWYRTTQDNLVVKWIFELGGALEVAWFTPSIL